jgi:hypothetical protein
MHRARKILDRFKSMKAEKQPWLNLWQLCAEYVMHRKQGFTTIRAQAQIQTEHIFDDTAPKANTLMASSIIGALWPSGAKSFQIVMPDGLAEEIGDETEEVKQYYEFVTKQMAKYMDHPRSGFATALQEYMSDQGAFGISGIQTESQDDNFETPVAYRAVDAKVLHVDEGPNGFIDTIYIENEYSIRNLVAKYGLENVSEARRKEFLGSTDSATKVRVLQAIEPRMDADPHGFGVKNMPYASIHIDMGTEKILQESGFYEMPVAVTRFYKAMGEKYGRCPSMDGIPSILEANALGEAWILAVEKTLDPSLLVLDDSSMGGGTIDTSPGGITVVSVPARLGNQKPIEPLFLVGDLRWTAERRTELTQIIRDHFFLNIFFDVDSDQRMTLGEFDRRDGWRGQALNPIYSRQFSECLVPTIETTFNVLRRRGFLGVVPGSEQELELLQKGIVPRYIPEAVIRRMMTGQDVYEIKFISPAARIMQAEEMKGTQMLITTVTNVGPVQPGVLDVIDWDWTMRRVQELGGAARETILSLERLKKLRDDRAQMQQAQMQLEAERQGSETARNMGQAVASIQGGKGKVA